jgi:hypothetical protein
MSINNEWGGGTRPEPSDDHHVPIETYSTGIRGDTVPQQAFSLIDGVNKALASHLDNIGRQAEYLTDVGRGRAVDSFGDSHAAKGIDQAEEMTNEWVNSLVAHRDQIRASLTQPGDTAAELRNQRSWARHQRMLDNAADTGHIAAVAKSAIDRADREEIGLLAEELPSYLQSRGQPSDWINQALKQRVPELDTAERELAKALQIQKVLQYDVNTVKAGIRKGHAASALLDPRSCKSLDK